MKTIVVGVDGNPPAEEAARRAAYLAGATGARLHVVCAYSRDQRIHLEAVTDGDPYSAADEAAATAAEAARRVGEGLAEVTSAAVHNTPPEALLEEAQRLGADLIVVGNKRVQGMARVLGTIAGAVAHKAPCDVYVAHTHHHHHH